MFKKILLLVILAMSVVGCELLSPSYWDRVNRDSAEREETCYRDSSGYVYCEDRYGNRY